MNASLDLTTARRIESICTEFESQFENNRELPAVQRLSKFLEGFEGVQRRALLTELVKLDVELRSRAAVQIQPADYAGFALASDDEACAEAMNRYDTTFDDFAEATRSEETSPAAHEMNGCSTRYKFIELVGSGGMGRIWRVFDRVSRRTLAIKVVHEQLTNNEQLVGRLMREALVTGALQHPGIPPVFDHGQLDSGQTYFALKWVDGQTLDRILQRQDFRKADLVQHLEIFHQVAQTIAFAHAHGVIHRDIKPQNIMVGPFGEVQVMDWGMAKCVQSDAFPDIPILHAYPSKAMSATADAADPDTDSGVAARALGNLPDSMRTIDTEVLEIDLLETQAGDVLGTPAYMSPEQARGQIDKLTPCSDVFALGIVLFELLTGERLYRGQNGSDALALAIEADSQAMTTRLVEAAVDPRLIEICQLCLAPLPGERYSNAGELATAIGDYQASFQKRLKDAELQRHSAEVRVVEERKRRRIAVWMSAAVVSVIFAGLLGVTWQWQAAVAARQDADNKSDLASAMFIKAKNTVDEYFFQIAVSDDWLGQTPQTQELRIELLSKAQAYYTDFLETSPNDPELLRDIAIAHIALAQINDALARFDLRLEHSLQAVAIFEEMLSKGLTPSYTRQRLLESLAALADAYAHANRPQKASEAFTELIDRTRSFSTAEPDNVDLGLAHANALHNYALHLRRFGMGTAEQGKELIKASFAAKDKLAKQFPENVELQKHYATTQLEIGLQEYNAANYEAASDRFAAGLATYLRLNENEQVVSPEGIAVAGSYLANAQKMQGEIELAIETIQTSLSRIEHEALRDPNIAAYRHRWAENLKDLSDLQLAAGRVEQALEAADQAISVTQELREDFPEHHIVWYVSALSHWQRAVCLHEMEDDFQKPAALDAFEKALHLHRELTQRSEPIAANLEYMKRTIINVGMLRWAMGDAAGALEAYREGLDIVASTAARDPQAALAEEPLVLHLESAIVQRTRGAYEAAIQHYREAIKICEATTDARIKMPLTRSETHRLCGECYLDDSRPEQALRELDSSLEILETWMKEAGLSPENMSAREFESHPLGNEVWQQYQHCLISRALALLELGEEKTAEALVEQVLQQNPTREPALEVDLRFVMVRLHRDIDASVQAVSSMPESDSDLLGKAALVPAIAARTALDDATLSEDERKQLVSRYAKQAADLLLAAFKINDSAAFYYSRANLLQQPVLKSISDRPEFAQVRQRIEGISTPGTASSP